MNYEDFFKLEVYSDLLLFEFKESDLICLFNV